VLASERDGGTIRKWLIVVDVVDGSSGWWKRRVNQIEEDINCRTSAIVLRIKRGTRTWHWGNSVSRMLLHIHVDHSAQMNMANERLHVRWTPNLREIELVHAVSWWSVVVGVVASACPAWWGYVPLTLSYPSRSFGPCQGCQAGVADSTVQVGRRLEETVVFALRSVEVDVRVSGVLASMYAPPRTRARRHTSDG